MATTGYFISLSGFTETALEQEKKRCGTRITLLNGEEVVRELINGRIVISEKRATELAGRCCGDHPHLRLDEDPELIAHDRGWIWVVFYADGKARTSFVLVFFTPTAPRWPWRWLNKSSRQIETSIARCIFWRA